MNIEFIEAIAALAKEKGISEEILFSAVKEAMVTAYKKTYGSNQFLRVELNRTTGEIRVYRQYKVVREVFNANEEISLEEATVVNKAYQLGDTYEKDVTTQNFGRIAAQNAKQVIVQRIREAERNMAYNKYADMKAEMLTGAVRRIDEQGIVYLTFDNATGMMNKEEQIPGESYQVGQLLKTYVTDVTRTPKGFMLKTSRTHPGLVRRLFELEVPEIQDGTVNIRSVVREPGSRAKISVYSTDPDVDAVGACVGAKGSRVNNVVAEIHGEKIDIIKCSEEPQEYVANALAPSKVIVAVADSATKNCKVIVPDYQLSLAIGKEGQNARLAARLTGWKIDIKSETQAIEAGELEYSDEEYDGVDGLDESEGKEASAQNSTEGSGANC